MGLGLENLGGNPWNIEFSQMFNQSHDSSLFKNKHDFSLNAIRNGNNFVDNGEVFVPLLNGSLINQFSIEEDPNCEFYVKQSDVERKTAGWNRRWFLGWRKLCSTSNPHLLIASIVPFCGISNSFNVIFSSETPRNLLCLVSNMNSLVVNYCAMSKILGLNFSGFILKQLPILPPQAYSQKCPWNKDFSVGEWIFQRAFELIYSNSLLEEFAKDVGFFGSPFNPTNERRRILRAEIDAAIFVLYGLLNRDDVEFIIDQFGSLRKKDLKEHGSFKTKQLTMEIYDSLITSARNQKQSSISSASSISLVMR